MFCMGPPRRHEKVHGRGDDDDADETGAWSCDHGARHCVNREVDGENNGTEQDARERPYCVGVPARRREADGDSVDHPVANSGRLLVRRLRGGVDAASDIGTQRAYYVDRL